MTSKERVQFETRNDNWVPVKEQIDQLWTKWTSDGQTEPLRIDDLGVLLEDVERKNNSVKYERLDNNLMLFDELVAWAMNLAMVVRSAVGDEHAQLNFDRDQIKPYVCLCGAISSLLISIRKLILIGHDLPAKQVLRSLCEHIDLLNLIWLRPNLAKEFNDAETPEAANRFWHKHMSKGKLKRQTEKLLFSAADADAVNEWRLYRASEEKILGAAIHPTSLGCAMGTIPPGSHPDLDLIGFMGVRAEVSIRTIQYALAASWELLLNRTFPFGAIKEGKSNGNSLVEYDDSNGFHLAVVSGREVLNDIVLRLSHWQEKNPYLEGEFGNWTWNDDEE